jgi:hypothetical protein
LEIGAWFAPLEKMTDAYPDFIGDMQGLLEFEQVLLVPKMFWMREVEVFRVNHFMHAFTGAFQAFERSLFP